MSSVLKWFLDGSITGSCFLIFSVWLDTEVFPRLHFESWFVILFHLACLPFFQFTPRKQICSQPLAFYCIFLFIYFILRRFFYPIFSPSLSLLFLSPLSLFFSSCLHSRSSRLTNRKHKDSSQTHQALDISPSQCNATTAKTSSFSLSTKQHPKGSAESHSWG